MQLEGEFLNDKIWNCKGKFLYNGNVEFEGEYLKGKKWNGKGYDKNGNVIYEIKDGAGKIKEYRLYMKFEGEYLNKWRKKWKRKSIW